MYKYILIFILVLFNSYCNITAVDKCRDICSKTDPINFYGYQVDQHGSCTCRYNNFKTQKFQILTCYDDETCLVKKL